MAVSEHQPGPSRWLAIVFIVCGIALGAPTAYKVGAAFINTVLSPPKVHIPGETKVYMDAGKYVLFQRTGSTTGGGGLSFTTDNGVSLDPSMVSVISGDGTTIPVSVPGSTDTITQGSRRYTGAVEFRVPSDGNYRIRVDGPPQADGLVTHSFGETFRALLGWLGLGVLAVLVFAGGLTLLIVGEVRRSRARRPSPPPPAWLPPPPT